MVLSQNLLLNAIKMFKYADGNVWNDVPNYTQNALSVEVFKYAYKKIHFNQSNIH